MNWERSTPTWPSIAVEDIPAELVRGLDRYSTDATLTKVRLRWRPHNNDARRGFLTKDRLLNISERSSADIAAAVASYAVHLHEEGLCESRFEAQVHRILEDPAPGSRSREWRSITFYLPRAGELAEQFPSEEPSEELDDDTANGANHDNDDNDDNGDDDMFDDDIEDNIDEELIARFDRGGAQSATESTRSTSSSKAGSVHVEALPDRLRARRARGRARSIAPELDYKQYEEFVGLSRRDPNAFAMLVVQQSHDLTIGVLTDLLYSSTDRVDTILATQVSGSRYLNEALNTLTQGAGRIAGLGVELFERGLENQARVAQEERETVLGRERNEITRDAIKQGSLLVQTIVMANAAKRNQEERERARDAERSQATGARRPKPRVVDTEVVEQTNVETAANDEHPAAPSPSSSKTALELDIEAKTERFLDLLQHEPLDELRSVAPTLSAFFDRLGHGPLDGGRILELIAQAEQTVEREELMKVHTLVSAELASAFASLMMRAMSES